MGVGMQMDLIKIGYIVFTIPASLDAYIGIVCKEKSYPYLPKLIEMRRGYKGTDWDRSGGKRMVFVWN